MDEHDKSMKQSWNPEAQGKAVLFKPDELDLYSNKATGETFIFHGKDVAYDTIDHLEYDAENYSVDVVMKDGTRLDLGVQIQWLVRPYFAKAKQVNIVKTKDQKSVDGVQVPLIHKQK